MKVEKSGMFMHKGLLAGVAAFGLAASLAVPFVAYGLEARAAGWHGSGCGGVCVNHVDENADGVCDNRGFHAMCSAAVDGMEKFGAFGRSLVSANFIDADGDGICDNRGSGLGNGCGGGTGKVGASYIDEDADGVCDNYASGQGCTRQGNGEGAGQVKGCGHHGHHGNCVR